MDKYLKNCMELEEELGMLLGWTAIHSAGTVHGMKLPENWYTAVNPKRQAVEVMPLWARNDADAFQLMTDHRLFPRMHHSGNAVQISVDQGISIGVLVPFSNYENEYQAVRVAIVSAVIRKLKDGNG